MRSPARMILTLAVVGLVAAACGAAATSVPTAIPTQAAITTPAPTDAPTARPPQTPAPMTDGAGPEYVIGGGSSFTVTKDGTMTVVGDVTQLRGQEMTGGGTTNDPRVNGTSHITLNADIYGSVASEWGTSRITTAAGVWEGTWTGASWNDGSATSVSGWLVGSGDYAGWTYYFHFYGPSAPWMGEGIIFQGSPAQ